MAAEIQKISTDSVQATRRLATALVRSCPGRLILALHGDLGTGKTCFVQGLADGLGIRRPVTSPTFTLIREYAADRPLIHADLYRMNTTRQSLDIGLEEYFEGDHQVVAIEWAERANLLLPDDTIHVYLCAGDDHTRRNLEFHHCPVRTDSL